MGGCKCSSKINIITCHLIIEDWLELFSGLNTVTLKEEMFFLATFTSWITAIVYYFCESVNSQSVSQSVAATVCSFGVNKLIGWQFSLHESVQIRSYFGSVFSRVWTESGKIRTRNNSVYGQFSCSVFLP